MKTAWSRFLASLTPDTRRMLILLAAVYTASIALERSPAFDLHRWLVVDALEVWRGQIWRLASYALLPASFMDFAMSCFVLALLGPRIELRRTRGELWLICLAAAAGAGLTHILLTPRAMAGAAPVTLGLLAAWGFVSGGETAVFAVFGPMAVWRMVFILSTASFVLAYFSDGWVRAVVLASGALSGWLYLWLRHQGLMRRSARPVESARARHLEL